MLQFDEIKKRKRLILSENLDKYEKMDNFPDIIASKLSNISGPEISEIFYSTY